MGDNIAGGIDLMYPGQEYHSSSAKNGVIMDVCTILNDDDY